MPDRSKIRKAAARNSGVPRRLDDARRDERGEFFRVAIVRGAALVGLRRRMKIDLGESVREILDQTKQALNKSQDQLQAEQKAAEEQRKKLADLEAKLKDARDTIAKIAAVKDDDRGMVITLQGEVLFKTGKWDLKPGAMAKLDQIADALRGKEQPIVVFGFTDNVGTRENNMDLSLKRATSVRDYLVTKGIPADLLSAQGKGPDDPISDNNSVEGRAGNRRVEIVVQPKKS